MSCEHKSAGQPPCTHLRPTALVSNAEGRCAYRAGIEVVARGERRRGVVAAISHWSQLYNGGIAGEVLGADPGGDAVHPMRNVVPHKTHRGPGCHIDVWVPAGQATARLRMSPITLKVLAQAMHRRRWLLPVSADAGRLMGLDPGLWCTVLGLAVHISACAGALP